MNLGGIQLTSDGLPDEGLVEPGRVSGTRQGSVRENPDTPNRRNGGSRPFGWGGSRRF